MPVDAIAGEFSPTMGAPTKELYSMAGLLLIKEFRDWTTTEAAEAYMFYADIQYALNLEPAQQSMCERTIERYEKIFVENDLAAQTMNRVTLELVDVLEQDVSQQRVDSSHVFSDMAVFGRTRLMGVAIRRFLVQLKRHQRTAYEALAQELLDRYAPSVGHLFGEVAKDGESRRALRQQVGQEMYELIERFAEAESIQQWQTYKQLVQIFGEQCEVVDAQVQVKAHPGNDVIQNPSDADARRDGHKGPGYQVQIAETCSEANEVQLVTCALAQTASEDDRDALPEVLEDLEGKGLLPDQMQGDTHYGSDENVELCRDKGVDLQAPVSGPSVEEPYELSIDDFVVDEATERVERCPAGHLPTDSVHESDSGRTRTTMPETACGACEFFQECPVRRVRGRYVLDHTAKARRLEERRREQSTDAFQEHYCRRAGIESTNGGLKRRTGMGRVRARGRPRVFYKILMKICGWNVLRAAATEKMRARVAKMMDVGAHLRHFSTFWRRIKCLGGDLGVGRRLWRGCARTQVGKTLALAA